MHPTLPSLALLALLGAGVPGLAEDDPRALMLQARALQHRGGGDDPKGAVVLYRKAAALVPSSSQAQLRLSEALAETGDFEGALAPAVKATELDPRSGEAWAHLALLRYRLATVSPGGMPAAVTALKKATRVLPGDLELWIRLAETEEASKDQIGALQAWLKVGRLHPYTYYRGKPLSDYALERTVELAVLNKQYEPRREAVLALCDRPSPEPRHLRMLEELARDQVDAGFLGHAEESFSLLAQYVAQEPAIWENIALIQLRTSRYELALASLAKAEALRKSTTVSFHTGYCLMRLGRLAEAEARWRDLLPVVLADASLDAGMRKSVKSLYAGSLLLQDRPQEMLDLVRAWPEPELTADLAVMQAQAEIRLGDWKAARARIRQGIARFPKQEFFRKAALLPAKYLEDGWFKGDAKTALAQLELEASAALWSEFNGWERCLAAVASARKAGPVRNVDLLLLESNALESLGEDGRAMEVLREAQRLDAGNPTVQNNLGYLLLEKGGDVAEASRLIQAALAKEPGNSSTMDSWGWALYKQGRYQEAEATLRKAAGLAPYSPEIHKHLGETLIKLDRPQDALDEWERALAYVFPERKELEKQVQDLRIRIARSKRAEATDDAATAVPEDDDNEDEEP